MADKAGLSPQAVQSLVNSPNMWSTAMLVKYGPPGSAWATNERGNDPKSNDPSLLAQLTLETYQDLENGKITVPVGFGGSSSDYGPQDHDQLVQPPAGQRPAPGADAGRRAEQERVLAGSRQRAVRQRHHQHAAQRRARRPARNSTAGSPRRRASNGQYTGTFQLIPPGKSVPRQDDLRRGLYQHAGPDRGRPLPRRGHLGAARQRHQRPAIGPGRDEHHPGHAAADTSTRESYSPATTRRSSRR